MNYFISYIFIHQASQVLWAIYDCPRRWGLGLIFLIILKEEISDVTSCAKRGDGGGAVGGGGVGGMGELGEEDGGGRGGTICCHPNILIYFTITKCSPHIKNGFYNIYRSYQSYVCIIPWNGKTDYCTV